MSSPFRSRIYNRYVKGRAAALAPESLDGLSPCAPYFDRLIQRHFPPDRNSTVTDLGCGHGALMYFARRAGYIHVNGVDGSPEQVEASRRLGIVGVIEGSITDYLAEIADGSQDCIVTFDVIEHFTRDELIGLVDSVHRVLKSNGRWIIHVPNGESPFSGRMRYWDITHELAFTSTSIAQLLCSSGFSAVSSYEDEPVPHGLKSLSRLVLWRFFRALLRLYLAAETGDIGRDAIFSQNMLTVAVK